MTRLGNVQRNETRRETRSTLLTALLWLVTAVIVVAMLLRMLPNNLDGKRYVPLVVALMPWLGLLSVANKTKPDTTPIQPLPAIPATK